jgi:60 kDa SS-A/Ro ribonucleoprotein
MKTNVLDQSTAPRTHEGAPAARIKPLQELRRTVLACMLWEQNFYESGVSVAERIAKGVAACKPADVAELAFEARTKFKLRHVPLFLLRELVRTPAGREHGAHSLADVIQRPDELGEFLSLYWRDAGTSKRNHGKGQPLPACVKKGLARALAKFNEYQLAKWDQSSAAVKLRDVLFLTHAKPRDAEQAELWKRLVAGTLATPDTWEVELSKSTDKRASWERLLSESKLGALALLRNLRNMKDAGVRETLVISALDGMKAERVLPFRFVAAARHAPQWEPYLETAMLKCLDAFDKLPGKTVIVVDNSGSMNDSLSAKSDLTRRDAACALAMLVREVCQRCAVIGFGTHAALLPPRRGFALREVISKGPGGGTNTKKALDLAAAEGYDRIIVITDEQSHQAIGPPVAETKGYFINVATHQNGIGYGAWTHIDGFSEAVLDFIRESELAPAGER